MNVVPNQSLKPTPGTLVVLAGCGSRRGLATRWASGMRVVAIGIALAAKSAVAFGDSTQDMVNACWKDNDHPQMSQCVRMQAKESQSEMEAIEVSIRASLAADTEGADHLKDAASEFESASETFRAYRNSFCAYRGFVAAQGNGAEDIRVACQATLDRERTVQLKASTWWLDN